MIFEQIEVGNMQNFSYIIGDENSKQAAIIDAGWEAEKLVEKTKNKDFAYIKTSEIIEREWDVDDRKVRPRSQAIGHSGFITFARKI